MKLLKHTLAALALTLMPATGIAAQWQVDPGNSQVDFDYTRNGKSATGIFGAFSGTGDFDPAAPETAQLVVKIDSRSIDLDDHLASAFATSAEWFDSKNHRFITYRLTGLKPRADGKYDATGELSMRGASKPVAAVIELDFNGPIATATGTVRLNRTDYLLGVGPSAAFVEIGPEVAVRFALEARKAP